MAMPSRHGGKINQLAGRSGLCDLVKRQAWLIISPTHFCDSRNQRGYVSLGRLLHSLIEPVLAWRDSSGGAALVTACVFNPHPLLEVAGSWPPAYDDWISSGTLRLYAGDR